MLIKKALCILQNAWSPLYAGGKWPRDSWLKALHKSRSGQRLKILRENCKGIDFYFDNTTPICGDSPNSVVKPDEKHIISLINKLNPDVVITFGMQAKECLEKIPYLKMYLPHPAHRRLKNSLYEDASKWLNKGFSRSVEINFDKNGFTYYIMR